MDMEVWIQRCRSDANILLTEDFLKKDLHGNTAFHVACACGQEQTVDMLLRHGAPIDAVNNLGWTPLMQAARNGHSTLVTKLLALGANAQLETRYGANLLFLASASNDLPTIEAVTNGISKVNLLKQTQTTRVLPLAIAIVFDSKSTIKSLLKINPNVNISSSLGLTPLMTACAVDNPILANFFLDHNANIDISNCVTQTALDMAILCQNNHIIRLLNGKRAEDAQLTSNRTHLMSHLSPQRQYLTPIRGKYPNVLRRPTPKSHLTKHSSQEDCEAKTSTITTDNLRPPSYLDHILSSARKSPDVYSNSPHTRTPNLRSHFSPYTKCNYQDSSSFQVSKILTPKTSTPMHSARSASPNPIEKSAEHRLRETDMESGYSSRLDQDKDLFPRQGTLSVGKHASNHSPIDKLYKLNETNVSSEVTVTLCREQPDSKLKSRWSGLHRTLSKLKSPKPERSFSPRARLVAVSQHPAPGSHLELVLQEMGLSLYTPLFMKQELDVETFLKLTEDDLKEIGISTKNCTQIMLAINMLKGSRMT